MIKISGKVDEPRLTIDDSAKIFCSLFKKELLQNQFFRIIFIILSDLPKSTISPNTHIYTHMHTQTQTPTHIYIHTDIYKHIWIHTHIRTYVFIDVWGSFKKDQSFTQILELSPLYGSHLNRN